MKSRLNFHYLILSAVIFASNLFTSSAFSLVAIFMMGITIREADVRASPGTIWTACFEHMKFEQWDADVERLEDVSGGCENGTTFTFVMKEGPIKKIPVLLSDVKPNKSLRFSGAAVGGLMKFDGLIEISSKDTDVTTSHIKYSFDMKGLLGSLVMSLNPKPAVEGTEVGLKNMVELSEAAEK